MKLRNVKKKYKKRIKSGWREYLDVRVPYKLLGLEDKFLKESDIERLLGLKLDTEKSGIVDHYYTLDYDTMYKDQPLNVHLEFQWVFWLDNLLEQYPDILYVENNGRYYYLEGMAGYKNPKCIYDDKKTGYPKEEPYWLYEDDPDNAAGRFYYTKENDSEEVQEILTRFANSKEFGRDLFSANIGFQLVSGNCGQNISNDLMKDLTNLSQYSKTNYTEFTKDSVIITYAIRYKEDVDLFLTDLKKLIKKHKVKL